MGERRPLVAISEGFADYGDYYGLAYPAPLLATGALPVLLPYLSDPADRSDAIDCADGLVLAGGRDIEPWRYGRSEPHPEQLPPAPGLDEIELDYARMAIDRGVPVIGICRGHQILNVALGGTLYGHMDEYPHGGADHPGARWEEWRALVRATVDGTERPPHPTHPISVAPDSFLAGHLGGAAVVNSYHHQAVRDLGTGLRAVAWAPHGVVEALEMPGADAFVLGVQWELHEGWRDDEAMLGIWRAFVAHARDRMDEREGATVA